jgi:hypothetical protein
LEPDRSGLAAKRRLGVRAQGDYRPAGGLNQADLVRENPGCECIQDQRNLFSFEDVD